MYITYKRAKEILFKPDENVKVQTQHKIEVMYKYFG